MKSYKAIEKLHTPKDIAESLVFPGTKNPKEREAVLTEFRKFRKEIAKEQSEESKLMSAWVMKWSRQLW